MTNCLTDEFTTAFNYGMINCVLISCHIMIITLTRTLPILSLPWPPALSQMLPNNQPPAILQGPMIPSGPMVPTLASIPPVPTVGLPVPVVLPVPAVLPPVSTKQLQNQTPQTLPNGARKCAIPECSLACYIDPSGTVHECCGFSHAMELMRRKATELRTYIDNIHFMLLLHTLICHIYAV